MGDRGNICMQESDGNRIYFYSHWSGSELFDVLQSALNRGRDRWDDEQYLARIIFCEMVKGSEQENSGYGISTYMGDNERPVFVVCSEDETVSIEGGDDTWSFQEFLELDEDPR